MGIGIGILCLATLGLAYLLPFPQTMRVTSDLDTFLACFEAGAPLAKTDGVTTYRRQIEKPSGRLRLIQTTGFLGPLSARVAYLDPTPDGFLFIDKYYESASEQLRPLRGLDWFYVWRC